MKKRKTIEIRSHFRRGKKGNKIKVKAHRKVVPIIEPRERKIFKHISDPEEYKVEFGGGIDFDKKGNIENINIAPGMEREIDLPEDFEVIYHTHPSKLLSLPTADDVVALVRSKKQQAELVFQNGKAYIIKKTPKSKHLSRLPDRKLYRTFDRLWHRANLHGGDKKFKKELEKLGFDVDVNTDTRKSIKLNIRPVE